MTVPRLLIAGVGNIFLGDDAFGVEVVRQLSHRALPPDVRVVDFGIRGIDLTYALLDGYETVILVDAVPRGGTPGQVYVIEVDTAQQADSRSDDPFVARDNPPLEMHRLDPVRVLELVRLFGGRIQRLLVVGCEPTPVDESEDIQPEMSSAAQGAVPVAVDCILRLIDEILATSTEKVP